MEKSRGKGLRDPRDRPQEINGGKTVKYGKEGKRNEA